MFSESNYDFYNGLLQVKATNMSRYCTCAGNFAYTVSITDFSDKLKTFRNVARYCYC